MNRFPVLRELLDGVIDAYLEGVLLKVKNVANIILDGDDAIILPRPLDFVDVED